MAKLTNAARTDLSRILADMVRAQNYLAAESIAVCKVDYHATTTLHFTRAYVPGVDRSEADARPLYRVAKDIGSDLCRLPDAIRDLRRFIESH